MQNGFKKGQTLIFDHLSRREIVDGIKKYPKEILKCHEDFVDDIRCKMLAEVEVVWGKCVRLRMQERYREGDNELEPLKLWGEYQDVTIFLNWEVSSTVRGDTKPLVRFIVFVMHPQVFLTGSARKHARWQDLHLTVAGGLARVEMIEDFYQQNPGSSKKLFVSLTVYGHAKELGERALKAVSAALGERKLYNTLVGHIKPRPLEALPSPRFSQASNSPSGIVRAS
jgi:hypothetical protein